MFFSRFFHREVKPGDPAPDFALPSQDGRSIRLADFRGKWVVLYFYPKDDTYGCIAESCDFRDHYSVFRGANAEVLGVSSDSPDSHARFSQKYELPFPLLSDRDGNIRKAYGVRPTLGVIPGRVTYVIDPAGVVRHVFDSQFNAKSHVTEALSALRQFDAKERVTSAPSARRLKKRWVLFVAAVFVGLYFFRHSWTFELVSMEKIMRYVELAQRHRWITVLFYVAFAFGVMALPITLFPIVGGVLCPFWAALPLNVIAATTGAWFSFLLSRRFGRDAVEPLLRKKFKSWENVSASQGFKAVVLLRLIGVPPFIVSNYALGLSAVNQQDFFMGTMIGILPWMGLITYASDSLWKAVRLGGREGLSHALWHAMAPLMLISACLLVTVVGTFLWRRRRKIA